MPFTNIPWSAAEFLTLFQERPGTKLSRSLLLTIPADSFYQNRQNVTVVNLREESHRAWLVQQAPAITFDMLRSYLVDNSQLPYSFIVAPDRNIYAIQHESNKNAYLQNVVFPNNEVYSRVKYAINQNNELIVYKSRHFDQPNPMPYVAGISLGREVFRNFSRNTGKNYISKRVEFLRFLGLDLFDHLTNPRFHLTENVVLSIISQCLKEVYNLHSGERFGFPVLHRDIKLENFVLSQHGEIRLIDFDEAIALPTNEQGIWAVRIGTADYAAPEIYNQVTRSFNIQMQRGSVFDPISETFSETPDITPCIFSTKAVDIYALGISIKKLVYDTNYPLSSPLSHDTLSKLRVLILLMIAAEPTKRLDVASLIMFMQHCFPQHAAISLPENGLNDALARAIILPVLQLNLTTADNTNINKAIELCHLLCMYQDIIMQYQGLKGFELLTNNPQPLNLLRQWQCPSQWQTPSPSCNTALGHFAPVKPKFSSDNNVDKALCRIDLGPVFAEL